MFEYAQAAVEAALAAGARYADARVMLSRHEEMSAQNGIVEGLSQSEGSGVGVRALVGSSWGFFATPRLTTADAAAAGRRAADIARASTRVPGADVHLADVEAVVGSWRSECQEDPFAVPLSE